MDLPTTSKSENPNPPLTFPEYDEEMDHAAAVWLDKIFKILLPPRLYRQASHTSYDRKIRTWLLNHEIAIAREEGTIAVIREGKVFAVWSPPCKLNQTLQSPSTTPAKKRGKT